jgi:hypothetical protein
VECACGIGSGSLWFTRGGRRAMGTGHECLKGQAGRARIKRTPRAQACEGCDVQEAGRSVPLRQDARRQTQDDARTQAVSPSPSARTPPACTSAQASRARPPGKRLETAVMWGVASSLG